MLVDTGTKYLFLQEVHGGVTYHPNGLFHSEEGVLQCFPWWSPLLATFYGRSLFGHEQRDCRADLHFLIYSVAFLLSGLEAQI